MQSYLKPPSQADLWRKYSPLGPLDLLSWLNKNDLDLPYYADWVFGIIGPSKHILSSHSLYNLLLAECTRATARVLC